MGHARTNPFWLIVREGCKRFKGRHSVRNARSAQPSSWLSPLPQSPLRTTRLCPVGRLHQINRCRWLHNALHPTEDALYRPPENQGFRTCLAEAPASHLPWYLYRALVAAIGATICIGSCGTITSLPQPSICSRNCCPPRGDAITQDLDGDHYRVGGNHAPHSSLPLGGTKCLKPPLHGVVDGSTDSCFTMSSGCQASSHKISFVPQLKWV